MINNYGEFTIIKGQYKGRKCVVRKGLRDLLVVTLSGSECIGLIISYDYLVE